MQAPDEHVVIQGKESETDSFLFFFLNTLSRICIYLERTSDQAACVQTHRDAAHACRHRRSDREREEECAGLVSAARTGLVSAASAGLVRAVSARV